MFKNLGFSKKISDICCKSLKELTYIFNNVDFICLHNQNKVLQAFKKEKVSSDFFSGSTGYGYDDLGRDILERIYSDIFNTEASLVRPSILCGTHALYITLSGLLRPGDILYSPAGKLYDTMESIIGLKYNPCSLKEFGINYEETSLLDDGSFDYNSICETIKNKDIKVVIIQRSRGYQLRKSFIIEDIASLIKFIKKYRKDIICVVDNCYGEFVETKEPSDVGADIVVGSLIKNIGGGISPIGGYITGKKSLIDICSYRLNSPGLGKKVGATLNVLKDFYQGLFLAPSVVKSSLKTSIFMSDVYEKIGFDVSPVKDEYRTDTVQSIIFNKKEYMEKFCEIVQKFSPVDSFVKPIFSDMPGYDSKVIMACGSFIQGSSIELSVDGPMKFPYVLFFQGGLVFEHGIIVIANTLQEFIK